MSRRLALVGATFFALVAAGPGAAVALYLPVHKDHPLVYKAMRPAQPVPKANPIHLQFCEVAWYGEASSAGISATS